MYGPLYCSGVRPLSLRLITVVANAAIPVNERARRRQSS